MFWRRGADGKMQASEELVGDGVEFKPEQFKTDIETSLKTQLEAAEVARKAEMKPLLDMAASITADREARAEVARKAEATKKSEENEVTDEDFLLDPGAAVDKKLAGTNQAVMLLAARQARRDVLEDKEYYYGDIKTKVDAMIEQQPVRNRMDATVIENCYKLIMFDHQKDIQEGKIKARNTGAIFESGSTGGHSGKGDAGEAETMSADEKRAAASMNISEKDWIASRKELSYV